MKALARPLVEAARRTTRSSRRDEKLNRMVNIWNPYQCMVTFNMSRSASYFETGIGRGMGFRDSNQDLLGFVHLVPERARERIIDIAVDAVPRRQRLPPVPAAHQARQQRRRQRLQRRPAVADLRRRRLHQGDRRLRDPRRAGAVRQRPEERRRRCSSTCKRSFDHVLNNLGPHGLPLIGRADWNDCLNLNCFSRDARRVVPDHRQPRRGAPRSRCSSPACSWASAPDYADAGEQQGDADEAKQARAEVGKMTDGRARARLGRRVVPARLRLLRQQGRQQGEQGGADLHRAAGLLRDGRHRRRGRARRRRRSTRSRSGSTPSTASCSTTRPTPSTTSSSARSRRTRPGYKENAGIFCHNNPWIMIAETVIGRGDRAFEYYKKIAPAYLEEHQRDPPHWSPTSTRR